MAGAKGSNPLAWEDPFLLEAQLGEEERMIRDTARAYVQEHLAPRVRKAFGKSTRIRRSSVRWASLAFWAWMRSTSGHRTRFDFFENQP